MRRHVVGRLGIVAAAAVSLALFAITPGSARADETGGVCDAKVSVNFGPRLDDGIEFFDAQLLTVHGFGFPAGAEVQITLEGDGFGSDNHFLTAAADGTFARSFRELIGPASPLDVLLTVRDLADSSCVDTANLVMLPAPFFHDIWGTHQWREIEWLHEADLTRGCRPMHFCPLLNLSRGEMAAFLVRVLELPGTDQDFFTDDEGSTYEDSINRLAAAEVAMGCGPELYCPKGSLTREEMASFLVRGFGLPPSAIDRFGDDEDSTHEADINALAAAGADGRMLRGRSLALLPNPGRAA